LKRYPGSALYAHQKLLRLTRSKEESLSGWTWRRKKAGVATVNSIQMRQEVKDKLALERYISHADIYPNIYKRLEKSGYIKDGKISDKGQKLLSGANE
jgi:hypothetical protein